MGGRRPEAGRMTSRRKLLAAILAAAIAPSIVLAQSADPGASTVDGFDDALLAVMKQGKSLGVQGRYQRLEPAVQSAFDLPTMTRFAVGPSWSMLSPADQASLVKAF